MVLYVRQLMKAEVWEWDFRMYVLLCMCESVHKTEKEEQVLDEGEDDKMQI